MVTMIAHHPHQKKKQKKNKKHSHYLKEMFKKQDV